MENFTIGEVAVALAFIVSFAGSVGYLKKNLADWVGAAVKKEIEPMQKEMAEMREESRSIDLENCKNFLVTYLAESERGAPHDPIEQERFWEEYEHYQKRGGNSYIQQKVDKLKAENKL